MSKALGIGLVIVLFILFVAIIINSLKSIITKFKDIKASKNKEIEESKSVPNTDLDINTNKEE